MIEKINFTELNEVKKQIDEDQYANKSEDLEINKEQQEKLVEVENEQKEKNKGTKIEENKLENVQSQEEFDSTLRKIEILEQIKESCFELMHINQITPSSYKRLKSAVEFLILQINNNNFALANKTFVSLEVLDEIHKVSKTVNMDENDIKVRDLMAVDVALLTQYLDYIMSKANKEIEDVDIDKLLIALKKANNEIDDIQA